VLSLIYKTNGKAGGGKFFINSGEGVVQLGGGIRQRLVSKTKKANHRKNIR